MAYNIIDILDKTITIANKRKNIYLNIYYKGQDVAKFKLIRIVLVKSVEKEIKYYENLKNELAHKDLEDIDFGIYDKIAFLMNQFSEKLKCEEIDSINKVFNCTLSLHKDVLALYVSIQGRLVRNEKDAETLTYEILSNVLEEKRKTIKEFERLLK